MESIQQQIGTLTRKVERVYQIVDRLNQYVFQDLDPQLIGTEISIDDLGGDMRRLSSGITTGYADLPGGANYCYDTAQWVIAQPEILIDASGVEISHYQLKEQDLSPQVQIQRLTAQLTAAYNRIAALEEQLLANRGK